MTPVRPAGADRGVAVAIALGLGATVLGLSRFGYGVLLPAMRADLGWSYAEAGSLETANALGYLVGALASPALLTRLAPSRVFRWCGVAVTGSLLGCATTPVLGVLLALRGLGGMAASVLFVAGGLLAARWASHTGRPGLVLGLYFAGVGPGILLTATLAPWVLGEVTRWQAGWLVLAALSGACAVASGWAAGWVPIPPHTVDPPPARPIPLRWALCAFVLFGVGYVPYITFVVQYWHQAGARVGVVTALWAVLAVAATLSGWVWQGLLGRPARALVVLLLLITAAVALPVVSGELPALALSSILFGGSFLAVSAAVTGLVRLHRAPPDWARVLAGFMAAFGIGQMVGPVLAGAVADRMNLAWALTISAGVLAAATCLAGVQARAGRGG